MSANKRRTRMIDPHGLTDAQVIHVGNMLALLVGSVATLRPDELQIAQAFVLEAGRLRSVKP